LEKHKDQVAVFYLPFCSPELNSDKYLNGNLKNKVHSGTPIRTREDLGKTRSFMKTLVKKHMFVVISGIQRLLMPHKIDIFNFLSNNTY